MQHHFNINGSDMKPFMAFMELFGSDMFTQTILSLSKKSIKMCECTLIFFIHGRPGMHWIFNNASGKVIWKIKIESTSKLCSTNLSIKCLIIIYNAYKAYLEAIKITTPDVDTADVASNLATSCWTRDSWSVTSYTGGQVMMWRSSRTDEDEFWCNA